MNEAQSLFIVADFHLVIQIIQTNKTLKNTRANHINPVLRPLLNLRVAKKALVSGLVKSGHVTPKIMDIVIAHSFAHVNIYITSIRYKLQLKGSIIPGGNEKN